MFRVIWLYCNHQVHAGHKTSCLVSEGIGLTLRARDENPTRVTRARIPSLRHQLGSSHRVFCTHLATFPTGINLNSSITTAQLVSSLADSAQRKPFFSSHLFVTTQTRRRRAIQRPTPCCSLSLFLSWYRRCCVSMQNAKAGSLKLC
ncbi:unnamed protein product [Protopolystoma xenopodis]|uniref:Uncharacterized protein n=1 Tax=Protopolystoma xenopodis TaxID=117903 RepID=A0A3S5B7M9_9PLAT|nr:unnamed protein product [Protopolystoma xenopodis]